MLDMDVINAALVRFEKHLKQATHKPGGEWRLGEELYAEKLTLSVGPGITPAKLMEWAKGALKEHRARMEADEGVRLALKRQDIEPVG